MSVVGALKNRFPAHLQRQGRIASRSTLALHPATPPLHPVALSPVCLWRRVDFLTGADLAWLALVTRILCARASVRVFHGCGDGLSHVARRVLRQPPVARGAFQRSLCEDVFEGTGNDLLAHVLGGARSVSSVAHMFSERNDAILIRCRWTPAALASPSWFSIGFTRT